ncbi:MAG TPA: hypothetical protein VHW24_04160, partial [Bryobacteraceae bacterium]|nr:hypothetical protein [Bryobacteraceae bacterium]
MRDEGNPGAAIVYAGLLCGVLDGLAAMALTLALGGTVVRTFQGIARGLLGNYSYAYGGVTVFVGVVLHFLIAFGAAATYYIASRYLPVMRRRALLCGVLFGIAVHLFMQFVVIPLSQIGPHPIVWR